MSNIAEQLRIPNDSPGIRTELELDAADEIDRLIAALKEIRKLVDTQAEDECLWFDAKTAPEAYLQAALRELHALIEHDTIKARKLCDD